MALGAEAPDCLDPGDRIDGSAHNGTDSHVWTFAQSLLRQLRSWSASIHTAGGPAELDRAFSGEEV